MWLTPLCPAGHLPLRWGDWLGVRFPVILSVVDGEAYLPVAIPLTATIGARSVPLANLST